MNGRKFTVKMKKILLENFTTFAQDVFHII